MTVNVTACPVDDSGTKNSLTSEVGTTFSSIEQIVNSFTLTVRMSKYLFLVIELVVYLTDITAQLTGSNGRCTVQSVNNNILGAFTNNDEPRLLLFREVLRKG